jgi:hypothetical protein
MKGCHVDWWNCERVGSGYRFVLLKLEVCDIVALDVLHLAIDNDHAVISLVRASLIVRLLQLIPAKSLYAPVVADECCDVGSSTVNVSVDNVIHGIHRSLVSETVLDEAVVEYLDLFTAQERKRPKRLGFSDGHACPGSAVAVDADAVITLKVVGRSRCRLPFLQRLRLRMVSGAQVCRLVLCVHGRWCFGS